MELLRLIASVRRHRIPFAMITVVVAGLGTLLATSQVPSYEVTSRIVLGPDEEILEANDRIQVGQVLNHPVMAANLSEIITSDRVLSDAQWATAARDPEMDEVEVTALIAPESNVIEVVVAGPDRSLVVGLVEPITSESVVLFEEIYPVFRAEIIDLSPEPEVSEPLPALAGFVIGGIVGVVLAVFTALFIDAVKQPEAARAGRHSPSASKPEPVTDEPQPAAEQPDSEIDLRDRRSRAVRRMPPHPADVKPRARVEPAASTLDPALFEADPVPEARTDTDDAGPVEGSRR